MILEKETKENFGYNIKDLSKGSHKIVIVKCDYCKEKMERKYILIMKGRKKIDKDACKDCASKKREEIELKLYGGTNPFQRQEVKDKIKETNIERYGVGYASQSEEIKEKTRKTCLQKYSVECPLQNKEIQDKRKKTCLEKHGVEYPIQNEDIKEQIKKTNKEKYDCEYPSQNLRIKNKIRKSHFKKTASQIQNAKDIRKKTCIEKYGTEHASQSKDIKLKIRNTRIKNGNTKIYNGKTIRELSQEIDKSYSLLLQQVKKYGFEEAIKRPKYTSNLEETIKFWLNEENIEYIQQFRIKNKICDFLIDNVVLELNGNYWHSDIFIEDNNYHFNKKELYNNEEYQSLFFREDEVNNKFDIVKSIIKNKLNMSNKIYARNCKFDILDKKEAKDFFVNNHLMGTGKGYPYALIYKGNIVSVIQILKNKNNNYEISRFCSVLNTSVIGGFSKLLKNIEKLFNMDSLITFVDRRYGDGKYLSSLGFIKTSCYKSFKWTNGREVFNRMRFPSNSGYENGFAKLWDCGQIKYIKHYNTNA